MQFGEWVRALRLQRGWSGEELARRADVARLTVIRLEKLTEPNVSDITLTGLARAFGWTVSELKAEWTRAKTEDELTAPHDMKGSIPVLNGDVQLSVSLVDDPQAFAYVVEGPLMEPEYRDGDLVVFSPAANATDGEDAYVELANGSKHFRKMFKRGPDLILQTYQPAPPIIVPSSQVKQISGVLLSIRR